MHDFFVVFLDLFGPILGFHFFYKSLVFLAFEVDFIKVSLKFWQINFEGLFFGQVFFVFLLHGIDFIPQESDFLVLFDDNFFFFKNFSIKIDIFSIKVIILVFILRQRVAKLGSIPAFLFGKAFPLARIFLTLLLFHNIQLRRNLERFLVPLIRIRRKRLLIGNGDGFSEFIDDFCGYLLRSIRQASLSSIHKAIIFLLLLICARRLSI